MVPQDYDVFLAPINDVNTLQSIGPKLCTVYNLSLGSIFLSDESSNLKESMHSEPKHGLFFYYDTLKAPKLMSLNENSKNYGAGISNIVAIVFIIMAIHEVLQKCFGFFFFFKFPMINL